MVYKPLIRLEDLDFKNITDDELQKFIFQIDAVQGKRFKKLLIDPKQVKALEISRTGILGHLIACLRMDVKPDLAAFREIMDDASNGRTVFNTSKITRQINTFKKTDITAEMEEMKKMGLKKGNTKPKKILVEDGLSASNKLFIFVEPAYEVALREWLSKYEVGNFIRIDSAEKAKNFGSCQLIYKNLWSVVRSSEFPKNGKDFVNPKTGKIRFEYFTNGLALATAISERLKISLPAKVVEKLTPPPVIVNEPVREEEVSMLKVKEDLTRLWEWILLKAEKDRDWRDEFERLWDLSRNHQVFKFVGIYDFTLAAFKGLASSPKVPTGTMREIIFFYKEHKLLPGKKAEAIEFIKLLNEYGFKNVQEATVNQILRKYVPPKSVRKTEESQIEETSENIGETTKQQIASEPVAKNAKSEKVEKRVTLKSLIQSYLASDGTFSETYPSKNTLHEAVLKVIPTATQSSFDTTYFAVRRELKVAAEKNTEASATANEPETTKVAEGKSDEVIENSEAQSVVEAFMLEKPIQPADPFTLKAYIRANLAPDGSLPVNFKTLKAFLQFLLQESPTTKSYKSLENNYYDVRKVMQNELEKADENIEPTVSAAAETSSNETSELLEQSSEEKTHTPEPQSEVVVEEAKEEISKVSEIFETTKSEEATEEVSATPENSEVVESELADPAVSNDQNDEEFNELQTKIRNARELFTELDNNPEFIRLMIKFRHTMPELISLSRMFTEKDS